MLHITDTIPTVKVAHLEPTEQLHVVDKNK
jgi:hypothetical protein